MPVEGCRLVVEMDGGVKENVVVVGYYISKTGLGLWYLSPF